MDKFTKGKKLGEGNFGITYLCTNIATRQRYACKSIPKQKITSKEKLETIQFEIDILRSINLLKHPNIVSIKDVFEDDTFVNIVMELCEGGELFHHICEYGVVQEPTAARMIKEIVGAIEACHSLGIVHRDLKLENLLFKTKNKDSPLKLIDFGFAQFLKKGEGLINVVGSPVYIAPEVMDGHHGPKADIWSAGVILYVLLSQSYPFLSNTCQGTYKEIMKRNDVFAKCPWPSISEGAKDLIQKMLTHKVNERLSASEVLKHHWIQENVK